MKLMSALSAMSLVVLTSCSSGPIVREDPKADRTVYRTYQWVGQDQVSELNLSNPDIDFLSGQTRIVNRPEVEARVKKQVDADLQGRGFVLASGSPPDFYVTYYGKAKDDDWISTWNGLTPTANQVPVIIFPGYKQESTGTYRDGAVYLTFYDAKSKKPSWAGSVIDASYGKDFDQPALVAAVDSLVKSFAESAKKG
jgi:hypothetical protein